MHKTCLSQFLSPKLNYFFNLKHFSVTTNFSGRHLGFPQI